MNNEIHIRLGTQIQHGGVYMHVTKKSKRHLTLTTEEHIPKTKAFIVGNKISFYGTPITISGHGEHCLFLAIDKDWVIV